MEYVELKITDDYKHVMKCNTSEKAALVTVLQSKLNALYDVIDNHFSYDLAKIYYSIGYNTYTEFETWFHIFYLMDMCEDDFSYKATHVMHDYICTLIDKKRGDR